MKIETDLLVTESLFMTEPLLVIESLPVPAGGLAGSLRLRGGGGVALAGQHGQASCSLVSCSLVPCSLVS